MLAENRELKFKNEESEKEQEKEREWSDLLKLIDELEWEYDTIQEGEHSGEKKDKEAKTGWGRYDEAMHKIDTELDPNIYFLLSRLDAPKREELEVIMTRKNCSPVSQVIKRYEAKMKRERENIVKEVQRRDKKINE